MKNKEKNKNGFNVRTFLRWLGNKELNIKNMENYRIYLNTIYPNRGTINMKWVSARKYFINKANYPLPYKRKELWWIQQCMPYGKRNTETAYLITEKEYKKLIENDKSRKRICFMKYIWKTGKRITAVINTLNDDSGISSNLYKEILNEFNSGKYLFETSTSKQYSRNYITSEFKKIGVRIIGKEITAESFRTNFVKREAS